MGRMAPGAVLARDLGQRGAATALICDGRRITYAELAARVAETGRRLGSRRRLVAVAMAAELDPVVAYLACLAGGHVAMLLPAGPDDPRSRDIVAAYRPDAIVAAGIDGWNVDLCGTPPAGDALHPELALLLSTSGSTGSAKTVRLSYDNVQSNAEAIAEYLSIGPGDVVPTTLPLSYCYGLSLLNSHLCAGAAVALTGLSVVDECFWDLMTATGATALAGVPYTFDLLAAAGFADRDLPALRRVLQAGGPMDPERVRELAHVGSRRGFDMFVMYGQTEATARMAYLPPGLAATRPDCIGVAIPGGELRLDPAPGEPAGVGELVYCGRNVMLGYAECAGDLARGADLQELRTGDLAEQTEDGLFRIVGRRSRIAKPFGVRIDLRRVERELASGGGSVLCVEVPDGIGILLAGSSWHGTPDAVAGMRDRAARFTGLPVGAIRVVVEPELPRLANGKPDYVGAARVCQQQRRECGDCPDGRCPFPTAAAPGATAGDPGTVGGPGAAGAHRAHAALGVTEADLAATFARLLGVARVGAQDTFVGLGGDSLSYVAVSAALSERLGPLPGDWPRRTVGELARGEAPARPAAGRRWRSVEVPVLVRCAAVVLVVGSHIGTFDVRGGAHLLVGVAGYSFARFHLGVASRTARVRAMLASASRLAVLCLLWLVPLVLLSDEYGSSVLLVNNLLGPDTDSPEWRYWFVEALLYVSVGAAAVLAVPAVDRWQRRIPFGLPAGLMGAGALAAVLTAADSGPASMYTPVAVAWLFCAGWALAAATRTHQQVVVLAAVAATAMLFFNRPDRTAVVVAGLALVAFVAHVRLPRRVVGPVNALAAASLAVYLSHYQVYPLLPAAPWAGLALSLVVGVVLWTLVQRLTPRMRAVRRVSPQVGVGRAPNPRVRLFPGLSERRGVVARLPAGLPVARGSGSRPLRTTPGRDGSSVHPAGAR